MHRVTVALLPSSANRQHAHQNTAEPVGKAAPVQISHRKRFHLRQNGCSCRGKAGNRLKQRIHKMRNLPGKIERKAAQKTHHDPACPHAHKSFPRVKPLSGFSAEQKQKKRRSQCNDHSSQKSKNRLLFLMIYADQQGRKHKHHFHNKYPADKFSHHSIIHVHPHRLRSMPVLLTFSCVRLHTSQRSGLRCRV